MSDAATDDHVQRYEIRLEGHLDARWAAWLDASSLTHDRDGSTSIQVRVVDQAALHGLLRKVRDVGLPLLSVALVDRAQPDVPPAESRSVTTRRTLP